MGGVLPSSPGQRVHSWGSAGGGRVWFPVETVVDGAEEACICGESVTYQQCLGVAVRLLPSRFHVA